MKPHGVTIKIVSPFVLPAPGPFASLLNEIANREHAALELEVEKRKREASYQFEAEAYNIPVETLRKLDEAGIPWRMMIRTYPVASPTE